MSSQEILPGLQRDPDFERLNGFRGPLGKEQIGLVNFRGQTSTGGRNSQKDFSLEKGNSVGWQRGPAGQDVPRGQFPGGILVIGEHELCAWEHFGSKVL